MEKTANKNTTSSKYVCYGCKHIYFEDKSTEVCDIDHEVIDSIHKERCAAYELCLTGQQGIFKNKSKGMIAK